MAERLKILHCINNSSLTLNKLDEISSRTSLDSQRAVIASVEEILCEIKKFGDQALISFTEKFDGFNPEPLEVPLEKMIYAWEKTPKPLQDALVLAHDRIEAFHKHQFPKDFLINGEHGEQLGRRWNPVGKAGIYIPVSYTHLRAHET